MKQVYNYIVFNSYLALQKILVNEELTIKDWNSLTKTFESVEKQYNHIEKKRVYLIKKYGEIQDDGNYIVKKRFKEFEKDFNELLNLKEDIDVREFDLDIVQNTKLKLSELNALKELFRVEVPEGKEIVEAEVVE